MVSCLIIGYFPLFAMEPLVLEPLLTIKDLNWQINDKAILTDINFTIKTGQFIGIIGTNGSGKSSLLRTIYRYIKPSSGSVTIDKLDIWQQNSKQVAQQVAVVQQNHEQLPYRVIDIIKMGLTPHKSFFESDNPDDLKTIEQAISDVGISHLINQNYQTLSGGEQQRVLIARAIAQQTPILIMDEPTNHLDIHYQIDILNRIKSLNKTVIVSLHDLNIASAFCDQLILLDQGKIIAHGSPNEVLTKSLISSTYQVEVTVSQHPVHQNPLLTFHYDQAQQ